MPPPAPVTSAVLPASARSIIVAPRSMHGAQAEQLARLLRRRRPAFVARARLDDLAHELRVARSEPLRFGAQIVFETGAAMPAGLETPLVDFPLVTPDSCGHPGRARQDGSELRAQEIEDR